MFHFRKIFHSYGNTAGLIDRSAYFNDNPFKSNNDDSQTLCRILASKGALYMTLCYKREGSIPQLFQILELKSIKELLRPSMCYIFIYAYNSDCGILGGIYAIYK